MIWLTLLFSSGGTEVQVVQAWVQGVPVTHWLGSAPRRLELSALRQLASDLLRGLSCLHSANIVHRDIRESSVFLDSRSRAFRLADFSVDRRLRDLVKETNKVEEVGDSLFPVTAGRGGKKLDIHRLGLILLSLAGGCRAQPPFTVPPSLPPALQHFLSCCLCREERDRWGAGELLEHTWLRDIVWDTVAPVPGSDLSPQRRRSPSPAPPPPVPGPAHQSRLTSDFEIVSWLGRGGFGDVIKVKNKLDEKEYAIKRILLDPADRSTNRRLYREVKLLSRLNHENVVRYYNSWQELCSSRPETGLTEGETETGTGSEVEWSVSLMPPSTESDSEEQDGEESLQELHGPAAPSSSHIVFDCSGRSGWAGESGSSSSAPGEESRSHPSTSEKPIKT